jgi:3-hydroxyisobutyrate dehydrogenase-like beta-hydroxyacid dehydrogenase
MKLVVNLVLGLNRAVLAEGLSLARACGLDLPETLRVLRAGAAYSRVMDSKGPKMIAGEFQPQARLSQHLKDVRLILAEAERAGALVPLSRLHRDLLEAVEAGGWGEEDNAAVIRAFAPRLPRQQ